MDFKRAKIERTELAIIRRTESRCGRFRISHFRYKLKSMPDRFYAEQREQLGDGNAMWEIVDRHRTLNAATKTLERIARQVSKAEGSVQ